ncbi:MAG: hypothetical protein CENE_00896 [Candidatus Celerinatantimonas neptuna]|nr:MAG: hypothetical protein CENE_00896 [Candidatus Celerinatantimonas neptuna]
MVTWNLFNKTSKNESSEGNRRQKGNIAENNACRYLRKRGLKILQRNYYCKGGELDIIARDSSHLVFVEVRIRKNSQFGGALASVTTKKQKHLLHAAYCFMQQQKLNPAHQALRFDIIAIEQETDQIRWIKNAFGE